MVAKFCVVFICTLPLVLRSESGETKVRMQDLPDAVQKTVREQTKNAKLRGLSKEIDDGRTFYEAETRVEGKSRDILIDSNGGVVEVEETVSLDSLPEAARKALRAHAGTGKILRVEFVTRGSKVSYEAVIRKNGKNTEVSVSADGAIK
jgi:uncharacterized membrane protein YkoI